MQANVKVLRAERRTYTRQDGKAGVAHNATVVTADGYAGDIFLGGDNADASALHAKFDALAGQDAVVLYGFRSFRGNLNVEVRDVKAAKA